LKFSLCLYAYHTPEICVEGAVIRLGSLSATLAPGRAERRGAYRGSYAEEEAKNQHANLEIAQGQLRDYEARFRRYVRP